MEKSRCQTANSSINGHFSSIFNSYVNWCYPFWVHYKIVLFPAWEFLELAHHWVINDFVWEWSTQFGHSNGEKHSKPSLLSSISICSDKAKWVITALTLHADSQTPTMDANGRAGSTLKPSGERRVRSSPGLHRPQNQSKKKKNTFGCENFVDFHNRKRIYHINILISIVCRKLDRVGIAGHERHSKMLEVYGLTWKTVQTSYIFWVRIQIGSNSATHSTLDDSSSNPNKSSIVPYWNVQGGAPAVRNEL